MIDDLAVCEVEEKDKLLADLKKMYVLGEKFSHIILILVDTLPENKFATSSWMRASLLEAGINKDKHDITPILNRLVRKEPFTRRFKGRIITSKATPYLESRDIDWDDPDCMKILLDKNEDISNKTKRDRRMMRLSEEGIEKVVEIRESLR